MSALNNEPKSKPKRLVLIDLDDTLIVPDGIPRTLPGAIAALDVLKECGYTLVLCSHNGNAVKLCKMAGIYDYFDFISGDAMDYNKKWNLEQIIEKYPDVDVSEMVFFDDWYDLILYFRSRGIDSCHVNHVTGLEIRHLIRTELIPWHEVFGYGLSHVD
jgi:phosphoglycolate phosphatase-like HAD superfamily hydrolase